MCRGIIHSLGRLGNGLTHRGAQRSHSRARGTQVGHSARVTLRRISATLHHARLRARRVQSHALLGANLQKIAVLGSVSDTELDISEILTTEPAATGCMHDASWVSERVHDCTVHIYSNMTVQLYPLR